MKFTHSLKIGFGILFFPPLLWGVNIQIDSKAKSLELYGFVYPVWTVSSYGVESFNQPNAVAYTAAANPVTQAKPSAARSSFHVGQSRVGLLVHPTDDTAGRLEFDFVDFSKATPTTASVPRVRRATVEYLASSELRFIIGQDWDLSAPVNPKTFNLVGNYFEAGNTGFQRIQAQMLWRQGAWEHGLALGLPGSNNSASEQGLELGIIPSLALRESYFWTKESRVGASLFFASFKGPGATAERKSAGAVSLFIEAALAEKWFLQSEVYVGNSLSNVGMLGLSYSNGAALGTREAGGFLTIRYTLFPSTTIFAGAGGAWILNPSEIIPAYTVVGTALTIGGTGPGIQTNLTARFGVEHQIGPSLSFFMEVGGLITRHRLDAVRGFGVNNTTQALVSELGVKLNI